MTNFLSQVIRSVNRFAPPCLAEPWDNTGILLEAYDPRPSRKVLLTIDLSHRVLEEAIEEDVSVIIAYHPILFSPIKSLSMSNRVTSALLKCSRLGISIISPHSALDATHNGSKPTVLFISK